MGKVITAVLKEECKVHVRDITRRADFVLVVGARGVIVGERGGVYIIDFFIGNGLKITTDIAKDKVEKV